MCWFTLRMGIFWPLVIFTRGLLFPKVYLFIAIVVVKSKKEL